jgi:hypothetical protein
MEDNQPTKMTFGRRATEDMFYSFERKAGIFFIILNKK